jgi:hypothetical protein
MTRARVKSGVWWLGWSSAGLLVVACSGGPPPGGSGFDPNVHGFGFQNYGNTEPVRVTNLTPAEMHRLFGDAACESGSGADCVLTAPARQWMEQTSDEMDNGHCEGMAVLSLRMFHGDARPEDFGAARAFDLRLEGNEPLQRELGYWWATQCAEPVESRLRGTPMEQVERLRDALSRDDGEHYTIAFWKRDMKGGHAVTPYDVRDRDDGRIDIVVYDNNFPGEERAIEVDPMANTWRYSAAASPDEPESEYEGDASSQTLQLTLMSARARLECPFCGARDGGMDDDREVTSTGNASLLLTDSSGRRVGHVGAALVNEIPGAQVVGRTSADLWNDRVEPTYELPSSEEIELVLTADDAPDDASVGVFSQGVYLGVENLALEPGQVDRIRLLAGNEGLVYQTSQRETADVVLAYSTAAADWVVVIRSRGEAGGQTITARTDATEGVLSFSFASPDTQSNFDLYLLRVDGVTELEFFHDMIAVPNGAGLSLRYGDFDTDGEMLILEIDTSGDGDPDDQLDLLDETGGL